MTVVVEVRFDCDMYDLTEEQRDTLLDTNESLKPDVGLGYEGKAAITFESNEDDATMWGEAVAAQARQLGLTVLDVEVLSEEEYANRAWDEVEVNPNG